MTSYSRYALFSLSMASYHAKPSKTNDVLKLLNTNDGIYAAACSLDFSKPPLYYDTFALRDSEGHEHVMQTWPFFRSAQSREALKRFSPVPVASCWNGMGTWRLTDFCSGTLSVNSVQTKSSFASCETSRRIFSAYANSFVQSLCLPNPLSHIHPYVSAASPILLHFPTLRVQNVASFTRIILSRVVEACMLTQT